VIKNAFLTITLILTCCFSFAQQTDDNQRIKQLNFYQDSLKHLGQTFINNADDLERKNANNQFVKTLVSALQIPYSFAFPFDSVRAITITKSPDDKFRIFSWHVTNDDGSYRFYGAIQMNTPGALKLHPLVDYSPLLTNPEDSVTDNRKWFGAQYYTIVPVAGANPYYVLLGWKGNTVKSTKKVIEVLSFKNDKPVLGMPVFDSKAKKRSRVVFEYTRQASMLLKYVPGSNLIVFDNLAPPNPKLKDQPDTYGPDFSYNGYQLKNGRWQYVDNLDMRNIPEDRDAEFIDPKTTIVPVKAVPTVRKKRVQ
jgi:hypothetical protein